MATSIKKISELEKINALSASSNVIIEENGKAKRFNANNIGKVRTVNGIEPDANGNIDIEIPEIEIPEINYPVTSVNGMTGDVVIAIPEQKEITVNGVYPDENGNIEIEIGEGGSGVVSWNDLTDKPFYSNGFIEKVVLPKTTYTVLGHFAYTNGWSIPDLIADSTYIVTWDGIEYECVAKYDICDVIGNMSLADPSYENTSEPFFIYENYQGDGDYGIFCSSLGSHTLKIELITFDENNTAIREEVLEEVEICYYEAYANEDINLPKLIVGNTYTVICDDVEYECVARDTGYDGYELGNLYLINDDLDTGEPFFIYYKAYDEGVFTELYHKYSGTHTIKITSIFEDVKGIDTKYLPDGVGYEEGENTTLVNITVDIHSEDLYKKISNDCLFVEGETYVVTLNGETYTCVAWIYDDGINIGNGNIYGGEGMGDDVPFSCDSYDNGSCYLNVESEGTYSIKIEGMKHMLHKIDSKYLDIKPLEFYGVASGYYDGSEHQEIYIPNSLPDVKKSDDNKVLKVVDGEWKVENPLPTEVKGSITWDGVTDGMNCYSYNNRSYYKVEDLLFDDLVCTSYRDSGGEYASDSFNAYKWIITEIDGATTYGSNYITYCIVVKSNNFKMKDTQTWQEINVEPGVYFATYTVLEKYKYTSEVTWKHTIQNTIPDITGETPTAAEFNALLAVLRDVGVLAP